jgi:ferredoxin
MNRIIVSIIFSIVLITVVVYGAKKSSFIDQLKCIKCGTCFKNCPVKAIGKIEKDGKTTYLVDPKKCIACGLCVKNCPKKAITLTEEKPVQKAPGIDTIAKSKVNTSSDSKIVVKEKSPVKTGKKE